MSSFNNSHPYGGIFRWIVWLPWSLFALLAIGGFSTIGVLAGYQSAWEEHDRQKALTSAAVLIEQYQLAQENLGRQEYDLARQRYEYILERDPAFPGAINGLQTAVTVLYSTATPTPVPPTSTPAFTPTPDLRPLIEQLTQAQQAFANGDWSAVIEVIVQIRKNDQGYESIVLDSLLYQSLRNRGLDKITKEANLEGGIYDMALAENIGPLDATANNWRNLARLYMFGSSFWEVFPERAIEFFSQVAAAAPGLRDGAGWSAAARYRASLVHYGNKLAQLEDWCAAQDQYDLALSMGGDIGWQTTAVYLAEKCYTPTVAIENTATWTSTPTGTLEPSVTSPTTVTAPTETPTNTPETISPTVESTPSATEQPSDTPQPSETPTVPVETPTVTSEMPTEGITTTP
jgi:tetratricopeptide (TPR) repeat protein